MLCEAFVLCCYIIMLCLYLNIYIICLCVNQLGLNLEKSNLESFEMIFKQLNHLEIYFFINYGILIFLFKFFYFCIYVGHKVDS